MTQQLLEREFRNLNGFQHVTKSLQKEGNKFFMVVKKWNDTPNRFSGKVDHEEYTEPISRADALNYFKTYGKKELIELNKQ